MPSSIAIRGVILDLDGTLADSLTLYYDAFSEGLRRAGLPPQDRRRVLKLLNRGYTLREMLEALFPEEGDYEGWEGVIMEAFIEKRNEGLEPFPWVKETLVHLKGMGVLIGVATDRSTGIPYERDRLDHWGVSRWVDAVITKREVGRAKPAPDLILRCTELLGLSPKECLSVGDRIVDILAGKEAGMITVGVLSGVASREELSLHSPDHIIEDLRGLPPLIRGKYCRKEGRDGAEEGKIGFP